MGVRGSGGVGGGVPRARPSHVAYYVALAGIIGLLAMLLLYFFYFFIKKVKKLSSVETPTLIATSCRPPPIASAPAYPVQPVVREGASEMAKLCAQVPPPGKGGTVYPTSTSPAAIRTDTGDRPRSDPVIPENDSPATPSAPTIPDVTATRPEPLLMKPAPPVSVVETTESVAVH